MAADYFDVDTEDGDHIDDPSEDALFMLLQDLDRAGNAFLTVNPADDSGWFASVSLLDDGTYEVERRDPAHDQHELAITNELSAVARELTVWLANRDFPGRP